MLGKFVWNIFFPTLLLNFSLVGGRRLRNAGSIWYLLSNKLCSFGSLTDFCEENFLPSLPSQLRSTDAVLYLTHRCPRPLGPGHVQMRPHVSDTPLPVSDTQLTVSHYYIVIFSWDKQGTPWCVPLRPAASCCRRCCGLFEG